MQDGLMILILAGGASSRMRGADKLLERIDGQQQLARIAQAARATGLPVRVALPPTARTATRPCVAVLCKLSSSPTQQREWPHRSAQAQPGGRAPS